MVAAYVYVHTQDSDFTDAVPDFFPMFLRAVELAILPYQFFVLDQVQCLAIPLYRKAIRLDYATSSDIQC